MERQGVNYTLADLVRAKWCDNTNGYNTWLVETAFFYGAQLFIRDKNKTPAGRFAVLRQDFKTCTMK